ncbi:MAG: hypothetical protein IJD20_00630, partial [Oscillospiraceae bacterium]|nr:hypothetical protein [Oscillospiraceae bacterium]
MYKNEEEKTNVISAKMLSTYTDAEFYHFYYHFERGEHPELTYQEIREQETALFAEKARRKSAQRKKRLPWFGCALLAGVISGLFVGRSDTACMLFFFAAVGLALYAFSIKGGPAEED